MVDVTKITIDIDQGIYGTRTVDAYGKSGLCVHKTASGKGWHVTHVQSTRTVNGRSIWSTRAAALGCMERLLSLPVDWLKTWESIQPEFSANIAGIREATAQ